MGKKNQFQNAADTEKENVEIQKDIDERIEKIGEVTLDKH